MLHVAGIPLRASHDAPVADDGEAGVTSHAIAVIGTDHGCAQ